MKEIKTSMNLESGLWEIKIYEVGNTYQIDARNGEKFVHLMISKRDYLPELLKKQNGEAYDEICGLSSDGKNLLTPSEFEAMKNLLLENMDADLTEEKIVWGIRPSGTLD